MHKFLSAALALASFTASADWLIRTEVNGNMTFYKDGEKVIATAASVYRPGWNAEQPSVDYNRIVPGTVTGVCGANRRTPDKVTYKMTYAQTAPDTLEFRHDFTPQEDTTAHAMKVSLDVTCDVLLGKTFEFSNGKKGVFPEKFKEGRIQLTRERADKLVLDSTLGKLTFLLDPESSLLIQDNRQWNHNHFELRYASKPGDAPMVGETTSVYKKGVTYTVKMSVILPEKFTFQHIKPVVMAANDTWIPLENHLDIIKDSVLDFTNVVSLDAPAGKHGYTKAVGQNFEYEKLPGVAQRFYGVNFCMSAHDLSHEQSDIIADRLARFGYNTVRFHHHENNLTKFNGADSCKLDADRLDRFDYLFAAFKKRGIYMTTDVYVSRQVVAKEIYPDAQGPQFIEMHEFKMLCPVNRNAMATWKRFAKVFLGHINPYTGLTLAQDPALNVIAMVNEGVISPNFGGAYPKEAQADWLNAWNTWVLKTFPTEALRKNAGIREFPAKSISAPPGVHSHFLFDMHQAMYKEMTDYLRDELGCKALFTDMNNSGRAVWAQATRATFDYVDDHFYIDHPRFLGTSWRLPSTCDNLSVMKTGNIGGSHSSFIRVLDRPFTITEWNYSGPGRYRGIGGIMTGCLAAIQNWAGLWRFAYSHSNDMFRADRRTAGYFDVVSDPFAQITERATICLFLRKDLDEAKNTIALTLGKDWQTTPTAAERRVNPGWRTMSLLAKVGTFAGQPAEKVPAAVSVGLTDHAPKAPVHLDYDQTDTAAVDALIRKLNWLPANNLTDTPKKIYQTADNQFMIDGIRNAMILNTPMTAGGFVEKGDTVVTDVATFKVLGGDATVWVSSVTKDPVRTSKRILLSHVTELHNTGQKYADEERRTVLAWGKQPFLVHDGSVEASLALANPERFTVYRINLAGKRMDKVATRIENGKLAFTLNIKHNGKAQLLYEVVAE